MPVIDAKAIGRKLTELRGDRTIKEVADAVKISVSALAMYERGERVPRDNIKIRLASYYNMSIQSIFFDQVTHVS